MTTPASATTSAVGCFPGGASPYGVRGHERQRVGVDAEPVGEGLGARFRYPYDPDDGREDLEAGDNVLRVLRGGAFFNRSVGRPLRLPLLVLPERTGDRFLGFRVVVAPVPSDSDPLGSGTLICSGGGVWGGGLPSPGWTRAPS